MIPFPDKKYQIIYADPPWFYKDKSKSHGGGAESHYQTMKVDAICNLQVSTICENNAILFLWATYPQLAEALKVVDAWGFTYKTVAFTWIKKNKSKDTFYMGMGRYTRSNPELCLLATKGKILTRIDKSVPNIQIAFRGSHSEKPMRIRYEIIRLLGDLPRIELFARERVLGWDAWGDEI